MRKKRIFNGIPLTEYCRKNNIIYGTIMNRIKKGMTLRQAIHRKLEWDKQFINWVPLKKYCRDNNISYDTMYSRLNYKKVEEKIKPIKIDWVLLREACRRAGVKFDGVFYRIRKKWMDPKKAIQFYINKKK